MSIFIVFSLILGLIRLALGACDLEVHVDNNSGGLNTLRVASSKQELGVL